MTSFHLGNESFGYLGERERAALLREHRMEENLEEYISKLFAHQRIVFEPDSVVELVCLFDQIRSQGFVRLSGIPFAAFAEIAHERERVVQRMCITHWS